MMMTTAAQPQPMLKITCRTFTTESSYIETGHTEEEMSNSEYDESNSNDRK